MESTPNQNVGAGGLTKKQELNNHIVLMRKNVRQAKVHVVRKLVREIKRLRDRKGLEDTLLKYKRKADRLHAEVLCIKNLKEDRVSVYALLNKSTLDSVLQNVKATVEERGVARLADHIALKTVVNNYRKANPNWSLQIPVLLEKNPQKQKKALKKQEEKAAQKKNKIGVGETTTVDESNVKLDAVDPSLENAIEDRKVEVNPPVESKQPIKKRKEVKPKEPVELNKTVGTIKVQVIKDWSQLDEEITEGTKDDLTSTQDRVSAQKPKSSFFVGGEDDIKEEEVNHRVRDPVTNRGWGEDRQDRKPKLIQGFRDKGYESKFGSNFNRNGFDKSQVKEQGSRYSETKSDFSRHSKSPRNPAISRDTTKSRNPVVTSQTNTIAQGPAEKLHPSWEAKKRQNLSIASFQGKKIKFD